MIKKSTSSLSFEKIQELINCIYDAALKSNQWNDVLKKLTLALHAEQAYMRTLNTESNEILLAYSHNKDPEWNQAYKDYYIHKDPWLNESLKENRTIIDCTHHLISDKKYEALEYHRDYVAPQGIHYGMGGKITIKNNISNYITFNRDRKTQGFENEYFEILKLLVPHIQKALLINENTRNIKLEKNLLRDTLNQVNSPLLLVNKYGRIIFINSQAEHLIDQQPNVSIKNNHINILSPADNKKLQKLIHQATSGDLNNLLQQGGAMRCTNPASHSSLSILVSPVNSDKTNLDTPKDEVALVLFNTNDHKVSLTTELLSGLYNLTPAEARLTLYLCQGLTLDEISEKLSRSKNTLRTQLRSSFNKIGVSRQADLIQLINTGPAGIIKRK